MGRQFLVLKNLLFLIFSQILQIEMKNGDKFKNSNRNHQNVFLDFLMYFQFDFTIFILFYKFEMILRYEKFIKPSGKVDYLLVLLLFRIAKPFQTYKTA
jgi:hypothetical protein